MRVMCEETVTETRRVAVDVRCDRCNGSMLAPSGNVNGVTIDGVGAYDSTEFADTQHVTADVCEPCAAEWFATFERNPLDVKG